MRSTGLFKSSEEGRDLLEYDQKKSLIFNLVYFILGLLERLIAKITLILH